MNKKEFEIILRNIGSRLDCLFTELWGRKGFALLIFDFNKPGETNYISNADRADMIEALKETVERFEKDEINPEVAPFE